MRRPARSTKGRLLVLGAMLAAPAAPVLCFQAPLQAGRFDSRAIPDPSAAAAPTIRSLSELEAESGLTPGLAHVVSLWKGFRAETSERWSVWIDMRSGAPTLVQGAGIPWVPGSGNMLSGTAAPTLDSLEASLRDFARAHGSRLVARESELVLDRRASGAVTKDLWLVAFGREVQGVPVSGDGFVFTIGHGNLIAFGAPRWSTVTASAVPAVDRKAALARLRAHLGTGPAEPFVLRDDGALVFTPLAASGNEGQDYAGAIGAGYRAILTWRFALGLGEEAAPWVALVDAATGDVVALEDETQYAQVKGGVFPLTNNGVCPDGCEQLGTAMPFASLTVAGNPVQASSLGKFACTGGSAVMGSFASPYVSVADGCGAFAQSVACNNDLDLGGSGGTDCTVPAGASAGDTHAARTSFYHLNRAMEHVRAWLPANPFLNGQVVVNTNVPTGTCGAHSNPSAGTLAFYRDASSACRNTGEIASVIDHEWGHVLSYGDGATGLSNPDEAYADITAFMLTRRSCIGLGFFKSGSCGGYGNPCLSACTGVRDVDWAQHVSPVPMTVTSLPTRCVAGTGPCGRRVHCESALTTEALWDLVNRDLPASGVDLATAWVIGDRLWFLSRQGSSGNAYSCGVPASGRSCSVTHWMQQLRAVDDDDGNLANGTPHAGAIFAAFNRHEIPCGAAGDAMNQSTSSCPALGAPVVSAEAGSGTALLSWAAVPGASSYRVLRSDQGCASALTLAATVSSTSFADTDVVNGKPEAYAVQAVGASSACAGPLSSCVVVTPATSSADLGVSVLDAPDPVATGENLTYTIRVTNSGPGLATGITMSDQITSATPFVALIPPPSGWVCSTPAVGAAGNMVCTGDALAAGSVATFVLVVRPRECLGNGSVIGNAATVSATSSDSVNGNDAGGTSTLITDSGACQDGDPCTDGDTCSGDGLCNPGTAGPPPEVGSVVRIERVADPPWGTLISWTGAPGTAFNVYRGWRPFDTAWTYNPVCRYANLSEPVLDEQIPPVRDLFWFLVTRRESCGESILGRSSAGMVIPNTSPCP